MFNLLKLKYDYIYYKYILLKTQIIKKKQKKSLAGREPFFVRCKPYRNGLHSLTANCPTLKRWSYFDREIALVTARKEQFFSVPY